VAYQDQFRTKARNYVAGRFKTDVRMLPQFGPLEGEAADKPVRRYPFTIRIKDRVGGEVQPIRIKIDPGSKVTGIALVRNQGTMSAGVPNCTYG
jgi:hypothetical protein